MTDWRFFSYSHPDEARERSTRKKIRAHVTRRQHALKRQGTEDRLPSRHFPASAGESGLPQRPPSSTDQDASNESALAIRQQRSPDGEQCWALLRTPYRDAEALEDHETRLKRHHEPEDDGRSLQTTSNPVITAVQLNAAPVPQKIWYGWLHDYWFKGTLPKAVNLLKINNEQLQRYIAWMWRLQNSEPAMYYMSLLIATGIPVSNAQFPLQKALWARGRTIAAFNEALSDPERRASDALIQAVGLLALHEHIYGDRVLAHQAHRVAQQRMIELRGGLDQLDIPTEGKQIMVWYDSLMAAEAGNEPYFARLVDGTNVVRYEDHEAIAVTNNASPYRNKHPGYAIPEEKAEMASGRQHEPMGTDLKLD